MDLLEGVSRSDCGGKEERGGREDIMVHHTLTEEGGHIGDLILTEEGGREGGKEGKWEGGKEGWREGGKTTA